MATSSVSEAKTHLTQLVRDPDQEDVVLTRHGQPVGVIMSARRYESLLDRVDDLEDRLSIFEAEGLTQPIEQVAAELDVELGDRPRRNSRKSAWPARSNQTETTGRARPLA